jgi:hypothetical protein
VTGVREAALERIEADEQAARAESERLATALLTVDEVLEADVPPIRLAPVPHLDLIQPGYTLVTGEGGAGKTTFMLWEASQSKMPVIHIDLEMGLAGLKQTYTDLRIKPRSDWHIVTKEAFYGVPPLVDKALQVIDLIDRAAPDGGALILLDGWNEYASRFGIDVVDGNSVRQAISWFSTHAKQRNNCFCSFEHLSKEAIREGMLHAKDSIEKTNAADGSLFFKVITPYSQTQPGGIRVGIGAKRIRGGLGRIEPRYFKAGGQGDGNQLIYEQCELHDIPEAESPARDAVLLYLEQFAPTDEHKRDKREILHGVAASGGVLVDDGELGQILDRLRALDAIGCDTSRQQYKYWFKPAAARGPKI